MTPKQRSLPKDKKLFHNRDKGKSTHKDRMVKKRRNGSPHRVTRLAANPSSNRNDGHRLDLLPNHQHPNSIHKASRL